MSFPLSTWAIVAVYHITHRAVKQNLRVKGVILTLTMQAVEVLTYIEQVYYESGEVPTNEKLSEVTKVGVRTIESYWKDSDFRNAIAARGMMLESVQDSKALTMPQILVANMLMNPSDRRSLREKLKDPSLTAFGITMQQVNGWLRSSSYQDHLRKRAHALFGGAEPAAYKNFVAAIEAGDQKSIALYFEMKGIYNPRVQVDVNISAVVLQVVEIVAKHVRDPAILQLIATDIDGLNTGVAAEVPGATLPEVLEVAIPVKSEPSKNRFQL